MKISNTGPGAQEIYKIQREKNQAAQNERTAREQKDQDRAEISPRGMELQKYREVMAAMPDARAAKVQQLKASIADGTYKPDAEKIAEGLLRERHLKYPV